MSADTLALSQVLRASLSSMASCWVWLRPCSNRAVDAAKLGKRRGPQAFRLAPAVDVGRVEDLVMLETDNREMRVKPGLVLEWDEGLLVLDALMRSSNCTWLNEELVQICVQENSRRNLASSLYVTSRFLNAAVTGPHFISREGKIFAHRRSPLRNDTCPEADDLPAGWYKVDRLLEYLPPWEALAHPKCGLYQEWYLVLWAPPHLMDSYANTAQGSEQHPHATWEPDECLPDDLDLLRKSAKRRWLETQSAKKARRVAKARQKSVEGLALACGPNVHEIRSDHYDRPERLKVCLGRLRRRKLWPRLAVPERLASDDELMLVLTRAQLTGLKRAQDVAQESGHEVWLPKTGCLEHAARTALLQERRERDTFMSPTSLEAARGATGGLLQLVDLCLQGRCAQGMNLCRPPGHHASATSSTGFCLVNHVAIATRYALKSVRRVLILDWDVHHGQGTQQIFWHDSKVLVMSWHLFGEDFYPNSGQAMEVGQGKGRGYTINLALPEHYTDACLMRACEDLLVPCFQRFQPELVLVSAGFDALDGDPLGGAKCSPEGFARLVWRLQVLSKQFCEGRLLLSLEGGYEPHRLADCVEQIVDQLISHKVPPKSHAEPLPESLRAIWATRQAHQELPMRLMDSSSNGLWAKTLRPSDSIIDLDENKKLKEA